MAERNWPRAVAEVLASEGGFSDNANDNGGPTNLGVTLETFCKFVKPDGTVADLKALTKEQAAVVFKKQYWAHIMAADLPDGVDYCVFDCAVIAGPVRAAKILQRVVGTNPDGEIATLTLDKVHAIAPALLINRYCDARLSFLRNLADWKHFGNGWTNRVDKVRKIAMQMADQAAAPPPVQVIEKPVEVDRPVAVVAPGSDKRPWLWAPLSGTAITTITSAVLDAGPQTKWLLAGIAVVLILVTLFFGERIIRRVKTLRDAINL